MKILEWDIELKLQNCGGPAGYLYNLKEHLKQEPNSNIEFLSDIIEQMPNNNSITKMPFFNKVIGNKICSKLYRMALLARELQNWHTQKKDSRVNNLNFNSYNVIHFHASIHLLHAMYLLKNYTGVVVLTSHSPEPLSYERLDLFLTKNSILKRILKNLLIRRELKAWKYADKIMFPVKDAIEVYTKDQFMRQYCNQNPNKFIFCPTAITQFYKLQNINIRERFSIPNDAFLICYIGRHNNIKGYDQLKKFALDLITHDSKIYFIIGGKEAPLNGLGHPQWIECGWTDYGNDLINMSDLFVLPNKETYFDIITLEVLRIGTPILLSLTGGNKYFKGFPSNETSGIFFYEYGEEHMFKEQIYHIQKLLKNGEGIYMRNANKNLFDKYFTMKTYVHNYINLINSIVATNK